MAYRVEFTARAKNDLRRLYLRICADDSKQAKHWFDELERATLDLGTLPDRCPVTPENSGLRHLLVGTKPNVYRVIFKIDARRASVTIVHVRHGARKPMA